MRVKWGVLQTEKKKKKDGMGQTGGKTHLWWGEGQSEEMPASIFSMNYKAENEVRMGERATDGICLTCPTSEALERRPVSVSILP